MKLSADAILKDLTPPQRLAAMTIEGPLLVLAGAGSGKTRTITRRVAYMIATGIPPWNILAITFTNKAAGEMRERITHLLEGQGSRGPTVATFHALGARLLREFADVLGLSKNFSILDSGDQTKLIKQAIKDVGLSPENFLPQPVQSGISHAKNKLQLPEAFSAAASSFFEKNLARVYARYETLLKDNQGIDFDDLLLKTALLLRDHVDVRTKLQERFRYILIDEYQDTNQAQFIIAHMLASNHKNLCATGDPDQSIYGWRGANLNNILEFEELFPQAKVVLLEQNYRSTQVILQAASALIANNSKRKKKDLWTENEKGQRIIRLSVQNEHHEASEIVRRFQQANKSGMSWDKMAIFYRVNSLSRVLEDAMMKANIPYQIARGTEFYARKEIKDVLAYLKVINNPQDSVSLERIINVPPRGLGDTSLLRIQAWAAENRMTLLEACAQADQIDGVSTRAVNAARKLAGLFVTWRQAIGAVEIPPEAPPAEEFEAFEEATLADLWANSEEATEEDFDPQENAPEVPAEVTAEVPAEVPAALPASGLTGLKGGIRGLMEKVVRESGLETELKKQDDEDHEQMSNVDELISVAAEFDRQSPEATLGDYLQQVTLVSDVDRIQDAGGVVTLMTLHAAKGLEFPLVAIAGVEDGLIPHSRAIGMMANPEELEEERRLAFVGITRAMKQLILCSASTRMTRGNTERRVPSQFFEEIPSECLEDIDLAGDRGSDEDFGDEAPRKTPASATWHRPAAPSKPTPHSAPSSPPSAGGSSGGDAAKSGFSKGMLVRHPQFGMGRIDEISPAGNLTRLVITFQSSGRKNLILEYANLTKA